MLPGRADEGRRLFTAKRCLECHAVSGQGRVGPDLAEQGVRRSLLEFAAAMWNKAPAMLAAMQNRDHRAGTRAEEMADVVRLLFSVRYFAEPGNIRNGWTVATYKGCLHCHAVGGERGQAGQRSQPGEGLESPAAVIAAVESRSRHAAGGGQKRPWPEFQADEMGDLVGLLQSLSRQR